MTYHVSPINLLKQTTKKFHCKSQGKIWDCIFIVAVETDSELIWCFGMLGSGIFKYNNHPFTLHTVFRGKTGSI